MDFPKRKANRLKGYNYSLPGAYFITMCAKDGKGLFSEIVGAIQELPENRLTECGKCIEKVIGMLPERFGISISKYVIMPNHIHMLIEINSKARERAIRESPLRYKRSIIDKAVGFLKMNVSKKMRDVYTEDIWQRSYHDHIIRGEADYLKISEYIDTNVIKWKSDCFYR